MAHVSGASDCFWHFNHDSNYVVGISRDTLLDKEVYEQIYNFPDQFWSINCKFQLQVDIVSQHKS